jgi:N6-adenosine-specific RNA methylase IME4
MAWTDACKIEACAQIEHLKAKEGLSAKAAIRRFSKECDIAPRTLESWYWDGSAKTCATKKQPAVLPKEKYETCAISDLQSLIDSCRKFHTIYADPPWKYSNQATRSSTDNHYKTLSVLEICQLPIAGLAADNSHLHLWTTNAVLFDAKTVMEAWGFEYKSCFVWVKPQMGIGNYWRLAHEFLLLGVKGTCRFLDRSQMSWQQIERTKHSSKPEKIRKIIEKVSPGPYLELFARKAAKGWVCWGNEIERNLFNEYAFTDERV